MALDHSLTYRDRRLKNVPHKLRLDAILKLLESIAAKASYCDVGCSNGYITRLVADRWKIADATGLDHNEDNLAVARRRHGHLTFAKVDLNTLEAFDRKYQLVTCLETLEHVGNLRIALTNLVNLTETGGTLLISVPVEIGAVGVAKFLAKTVVYRYRLDELNERRQRLFGLRYLSSLMFQRDITRFRPKRAGYGTHFGFDYRQVGRHLGELGVAYKLIKRATTAFYVVNR